LSDFALSNSEWTRFVETYVDKPSDGISDGRAFYFAKTSQALKNDTVPN
jgi:hypothetical protein|tara:strand:- start:461 stop:607 length:147 start_codon:yes stop_codon:yes gene_type:complete